MTSRDFQSTIDGATAGPDRWQLLLHDINNGGDHVVPFPEPGTDWRQYCGGLVPPGKYQVTCQRVNEADVAPQTVRNALSRLRKSGPVTAFLDTTGGAPQQLRATPGVATPRPTPMPASVAMDPTLQQIQRETAIANAEAARMAAELARRKLAREVEAQTQQSTGRSDFAALAEVMRSGFDALRSELRPRDNSALLGQLAPAITTLIGGMIEGSQRRDEVILQLMLGNKGGEEQSGGTAQLLELLSIAKELVGDSGGEDSMLGQVLSVLRGVQGATAAPQQGPQLPTTTQPQRPSPNPNDPRMRVLLFLNDLRQYAADGADPLAVADELEHRFQLLPREFRELVLNNGVDAILAGLNRWLPHKLHEQLTNFVVQDQVRKQWLEGFLEALRSPGDGDDDDLDDEPEPRFDADDEDPAVVVEVDDDPRMAPQGPRVAPPPRVFDNGNPPPPPGT